MTELTLKLTGRRFRHPGEDPVYNPNITISKKFQKF